MTVRPSANSMIRSLAFALLPAATVALFTYWLWENATTWHWVASGMMIVLSLFLIIQALIVHLQRLSWDEERIVWHGPGGDVQLLWQEVTTAQLMERKNSLSRDDRLLILRGRGKELFFNSSTLSSRDEELLLAFIRKKTNVVIQQSRPGV